MKDLESVKVEFESVGEFLLELKKEFDRENEGSVKVTELKNVEQRGRTIEEFVHEFRRAVRGSGYQERTLVEEFKKEMNKVIKRKLIEMERSLNSSTNVPLT